MAILAVNNAFFRKLVNKIDDLINPIVVKEIRQAVNSSSIMVTTILVLLLEVFAFFFNFLFVEYNTSSGNSFFSLILGIFIFGYTVGVGGNVASRMMKEHTEINSVDLIYTTTINSYRIVWGKLFSAMVMVSYLFSLCLPFMCISYFLKGITISSIIGWSLGSFLLAFPYMLTIIFITAIPMAKLLKYILLLGIMGWMVTAIFGVIIALNGGARALSYYGFNGTEITVFSTFLLIITGLFYFLTVGLLSHITSNRTVGLKIYYLFVIGIFAVLCIITPFVDSGLFPPVPSYVCSMIFLCFVIIFNSFERIEQTKRVLATVPKNIFLRIWHFLLSTGITNNIVYTLMLLLFVNFIYFVGDSYFAINTYSSDSISGSNYYFMRAFVAVFCYIFSYQLFGLVIKRATNKFFPKVQIFAYMLLIIILNFLIPVIIGMILADFKMSRLDNQTEYIYILNPIFLDKARNVDLALIISASMCVVGIVVNARFFIRNIITGLSYHKKEVVIKTNE